MDLTLNWLYNFKALFAPRLVLFDIISKMQAFHATLYIFFLILPLVTVSVK